MKGYTTKELKEKDPEKEKDKTEISNEAFAICDFLDQLIKKVEHLRLSSLTR